GWLRDLFVSTTAVKRSLVVRDWTRSGPILRPFLNELDSLDVEICDYFLSHDDGYETFHAKLLIADDGFAYVGSANFLRYRRNSVELGLLVRGGAARTVRYVVEGMKNLARRVSYRSAPYLPAEAGQFERERPYCRIAGVRLSGDV